MKEKMKDFIKRLKPQQTQNYDISKWVMMKNYQPFKIDEKKLIII